MSHKADSLRTKLGDITDEVRVIISDAERTGRALTPVEQADIARLKAQFDDIEAQVSAADLDDRASRPMPTKTGPTPVGNWNGSRPGPVASWGRDTSGFHSVGEYLGAVKNASGGSIDQRLLNAVTTYGGESLGPDGGFAVPSAWKQTLVELVLGKGTLIDHLHPFVTPGNMLTIPIDEGSAHSASGISATWTPEAGTITASKPALKVVNVVVHKVAGLCHASDELLEDAPNMNGYILGQLAKKIRFTVEDALVAGDGVGQPLGLLNGPGIVTQAKSATGSTAIAPRDLGNMVSRLVPGAFESAFWLVHGTVLPELWSLVLGNTPLLVADYSKSPVGTLLGRPVVVSESAKAYNTPGDIMLVAPEGYGLVVKSSGLRTDTTVAFGFDAGLQSFRATMRIGGQPLLSAPVARKNGSSTQSHVVALAARS
jgi:HK97 family phage major capsid protein